MGAESSPKIVIIDESPIRAAILEEGLREAGYTEVVQVNEMQSLLARISSLDSDIIQASVDAGVSAYIVDGLKKERIKPILDLCVSRFNAFARLQDELDRT